MTKDMKPMTTKYVLKKLIKLYDSIVQFGVYM